MNEDELLDGYPNLSAVLDGRISGQVTEWSAIRRELLNLGEQCAVKDKRIAELEDELKKQRADNYELARSVSVADHVEAVTKAIMFADCGNTSDWQDNTDLGEAAIKAYRPAVQAWRNDAIESAAQIADRYKCEHVAESIRAIIGGDAPHQRAQQEKLNERHRNRG